MIARHILPWYGGSPAVWTTCMLFFQVSLLAGYLYAHLLAKWLAPRRQVIVHLILLGLSLLVLPITPDEAWKTGGGESPTAGILMLLGVTVGFPYLMVSASAPLLQHWFNTAAPGGTPYRLYALSNLGSLLGLLSYPFLVEPALPLRWQSYMWSAGYLIYAGVCAWSARPLLRLREMPQPVASAEGDDAVAGPATRILWLALAACGSTLLLAVTNQVCQDIAVVPFLWVVPLSLYLLSFILCFDSPRWYRRAFWVPTMALTVGALVAVLSGDYLDHAWPLVWQLVIYFSAMFACCMVCHGELVRLTPPARDLTGFYLMVALGGALGGVFVTLVAPFLFNGYWELHAALAATALLLGVCALSDRQAMAPWQAQGVQALWGLSLIGLTVGLWAHIQFEREDSIDTRRNFYGVLNVHQLDAGTESDRYILYHGRIRHGAQYRDERWRLLPTTYYDKDSGVGIAIEQHPLRQLGPLKVGVIGLGVGTIASYGEPGDEFVFYEINPEIQRIAAEYFTYMSEGRGNNSVVLGDARIALERELREDGSRQYDVLVLDAFNGDALPVHLLTREAMALYWRHLKASGILALHVSNLHFDLSDVVRIHARELHKHSIFVRDEDNNFYDSGSRWILMTSNKDFIKSKIVTDLPYRWPRARPREILWTDDYSNLFSVLDLD